MTPINQQREEWNKLYDNFGKKIEEKKEKSDADFTRLIVVRKGVTIDDVVAECRKRFDVWTYRDGLNSSIKDVRAGIDRTKDYEILVRDNIEADERYKNMSAEYLEEKGVRGITLLERLLLELKYYDETGKHLDIETWTFCTGSRHSDGNVPCVGFNPHDGGVDVDWCRSAYRGDRLRAREVISSPLPL